MKQLIIPIMLLFCFILLPTVNALGLDYYRIEMNIREDTNVDNIIAIKFDNPVYHLDYRFDSRIYDLNVSSNFDSVVCETIDRERYSDVSCDFVGMTKEKNLFIREKWQMKYSLLCMKTGSLSVLMIL